MDRRRLAVICSHLLPTPPRPRPQPPAPPPPELSAAVCRGGGGGEPAVTGAEEGCVFCMIVRGESPAFKIYEDDVCLCFLDSNPLSYGHSLIIPKSHFPSLKATPPPVVAAMCSKVPILSTAIMKATQSDSFNMLVNNGSAAGQVIFHTHFHIIPRKADDHLWCSDSFRRQPIKRNHETLGLLNCIQGQLSSISDDKCEGQESELLKNPQE